jgi:hypothetical protein
MRKGSGRAELALKSADFFDADGSFDYFIADKR